MNDCILIGVCVGLIFVGCGEDGNDVTLPKPPDTAVDAGAEGPSSVISPVHRACEPGPKLPTLVRKVSLMKIPDDGCSGIDLDGDARTCAPGPAGDERACGTDAAMCTGGVDNGFGPMAWAANFALDLVIVNNPDVMMLMTIGELPSAGSGPSATTFTMVPAQLDELSADCDAVDPGADCGYDVLLADWLPRRSGCGWSGHFASAELTPTEAGSYMLTTTPTAVDVRWRKNGTWFALPMYCVEVVAELEVQDGRMSALSGIWGAAVSRAEFVAVVEHLIDTALSFPADPDALSARFTTMPTEPGVCPELEDPISLQIAFETVAGSVAGMTGP